MATPYETNAAPKRAEFKGKDGTSAHLPGKRRGHRRLGGRSCRREPGAPRRDRIEVQRAGSALCNAIDDDCDARIDEEGCSCTRGRRDDSTYLFCEAGGTWQDARDACRGFGYELVTLDDADEHAFAWTIANGLRAEHWWIGINDVEVEGIFVWVDGTPVEYQRWVLGQPNDGATGSSEDCGMMAPDVPDWKDGDCGWLTNPYVCETR